MTATAAPERSTVQRRDALDRANEVRSYRAQLKRRVAADWQVASQALTGGDDLVQSMRVEELLLAIRWFGVSKVRRLMLEVGCSVSKTVGGLSSRQRAELVLALARAKGRA